MTPRPRRSTRSGTPVRRCRCRSAWPRRSASSSKTSAATASLSPPCARATTTACTARTTITRWLTRSASAAARRRCRHAPKGAARASSGSTGSTSSRRSPRCWGGAGPKSSTNAPLRCAGSFVALEIAGLTQADVAWLDIVLNRPPLTRPPAHRALNNRHPLLANALCECRADAAFVKGPQGAQLVAELGDTVLLDIRAHPDPLDANHGAPRPLTASSICLIRAPTSSNASCAASSMPATGRRRIPPRRSPMSRTKNAVRRALGEGGIRR